MLYNDIFSLMGKEKDFKTLIVLQPILGTGNKTLSDEKMTYYIFDKEKQIPIYDEFTSNLSKLNEICTSNDMRGIYDVFSHSTYFDGGHTGVEGKRIVAKKLFGLSVLVRSPL